MNILAEQHTVIHSKTNFILYSNFTVSIVRLHVWLSSCSLKFWGWMKKKKKKENKLKLQIKFLMVLDGYNREILLYKQWSLLSAFAFRQWDQKFQHCSHKFAFGLFDVSTCGFLISYFAAVL